MKACIIRSCGIAAMLIAIGGCAGLSVHKAGDSAKGQAFYLPRVVMNLVPDEELGYRVEWKYLPDRSQEYRIAHFATWANAELTIATEGGVLKSIKSDTAADTVPAEALKGYADIEKAEEAAEYAIASAQRTAADAKLTAAKTERDALQTQFTTAETSLQTARTNVKKGEIDLFAAEEKEKLAGQRKAEAEEALNALLAVGTDKPAIAIARTSLNTASTALIDAQVARQKAEADLQSAKEVLAATEAKHAKLQEDLQDAKGRVAELETSLPPKPVPVSVGDVADTGSTVVTGTDGPVMFFVKITSNAVELEPLDVEVGEPSTKWKRESIALARNVTASSVAACPKGDEKAITVQQRPGDLFWLSLDLSCVVSTVDQMQVQLSSVDGAGQTEKLRVFASVSTDPVADQYRVTIKDGRTSIVVAAAKSVVDAKCTGPLKCQLTVRANAGGDAASVTYPDVMKQQKQ